MKNVLEQIKEVITTETQYIYGLDYTVTFQLVARTIKIEPIKGFSSNLRNKLIEVIIKNGYSPIITANLA